MTREDIKRRFTIIGDDQKLNRAIDVAMRVASTEVTVLVLGENGVGKDVFSRIIHQMSPRKHKKFIAINAGAIPEGTIDSELFGHEKGAFTSAYGARKGYFEEANGGVIFLDEIAELPLATQSRLLRVLESGEYLRVGSSQVQKTDVRIVAATNRNLIEMIRQGKFREDLYFRLNTVTIQVPPLRDRGEDIELLFRYFASEFAQRYGREPVQLAPGGARAIHEYYWPGNIRELRNFAEKVSVLHKNDALDGDDIREYLPHMDSKLPVLLQDTPYNEPRDHEPQPGSRTTSGADDVSNEFLYRVLYELKNEIADIKYQLRAIRESQMSQPSYPPSGYSPSSYPPPEQAYPQLMAPGQSGESARFSRADIVDKDFEETTHEEEDLSLESSEQKLIERALEKHNQNRKKAAEELGISERTLYRKIKSYGLE